MGEILGINLLKSILKWIAVIFILSAIGLGVWNYFFRSSLTLPWLSGLSSWIVWIIAIALFVLAIFALKSAKREY